jgi:predicted RNA methylase
MLSIGAAMLGAQHVVGVDVDGDALRVAQQNVGEYEEQLPIDFLLCDVRQVASQPLLKADTVVMNPPFGTRRKGRQGCGGPTGALPVGAASCSAAAVAGPYIGLAGQRP